MPGARCTRSLACKNKKAHEVVTTGSPEQPGIPRAMVLTVSFVLFPVTGLICHRRLQEIPASLMPASGHQNHTTSPSARHARSSFAPPLVHRIPCPTSVTIAKRPSAGRDDALIILIWVNREYKYFCDWGWTGNRQVERFARRA